MRIAEVEIDVAAVRADPQARGMLGAVVDGDRLEGGQRLFERLLARPAARAAKILPGKPEAEALRAHRPVLEVGVDRDDRIGIAVGRMPQLNLRREIEQLVGLAPAASAGVDRLAVAGAIIFGIAGARVSPPTPRHSQFRRGRKKRSGALLVPALGQRVGGIPTGCYIFRRRPRA